jgi:hypothetical protein
MFIFWMIFLDVYYLIQYMNSYIIFKKEQYRLNICLANNWRDNVYLLIGQINAKILLGFRVHMLISQNTYY